MKTTTQPTERHALSRSLIQERVIAILKMTPEGMHVDDVAEAVGCSNVAFVVWYMTRGKDIPGLGRAKPKSVTLVWDQSAADAAKE